MKKQSKKLGDHASVETELNDDYLRIMVRGEISELATLEQLHDFLSTLADDEEVHDALVDHRELAMPDDLIRRGLDFLHIDGPFSRVALVVNRVDIRRAFDTRNDFDRVELQTFEDAGVAHSWLVESESWPACPLAVFSYGERRFAVMSDSVDEIITYRTPAPIPSSPPALAGLISHRQRMVPVLRSPEPHDPKLKDIPTRILITSSEGEHLGIPAGRTDYIGLVRIAQTPVHGERCVTNLGEISIIDPSAMVQALSS